MLRDLIARLAARLAEAGIEDAHAEAWLLLAAAAGRERAELVTGEGAALDPGAQARLEALLRRRLAREPMAYILGEKEFWSLRLAVGPAVLIPRPDSETLVEAALARIPDRTAPLRILDLGTGSGCLLLALLSELPNATGTGVDASPGALAVAEANARDLGFAKRASFITGDWGRGLDGSFDLIVSNPPYVREPDWPGLQPEVRDFEPPAALLAGADGLDAYRGLVPDSVRLLATDGVLVLEIGLGQGDAVTAILAAQGLDVVELRRDLAGVERCLVARRRAYAVPAGYCTAQF
jgi:release factor glutamine methyltransferase